MSIRDSLACRIASISALDRVLSALSAFVAVDGTVDGTPFCVVSAFVDDTDESPSSSFVSVNQQPLLLSRSIPIPAARSRGLYSLSNLLRRLALRGTLRMSTGSSVSAAYFDMASRHSAARALYVCVACFARNETVRSTKASLFLSLSSPAS